MRKSLASAACALAFAMLAQTAAAQDVTMDGLARSASLMRQIEQSCAVDFDVDVDLARRAQAAFAQAGEKAFGKARFDRALEVEYARRAEEPRSAGVDRWCADQRERLMDLSGSKLFRK